MTNNLKSRIQQHQSKDNKGFIKKYDVNKLIYFEKTEYVNNAIRREKQIKHWKREWKENLINDMNPDWDDLFWMLGD